MLVYISIILLIGCKVRHTTYIKDDLTFKKRQITSPITQTTRYKTKEIRNGSITKIDIGKLCNNCAKGSDVIFSKEYFYDDDGNIQKIVERKISAPTIVKYYSKNKLVRMDTVEKFIMKIGDEGGR